MAGVVETDIPDEWDDELETELGAINQEINQLFRGARVSSDLQKVEVEDSPNITGQYTGRSDEQPRTALITVNGDRTPQEVKSSFAHEVGHDWFRTAARNQNVVWREDEMCEMMTLNEAVADLVAHQTVTSETTFDRNPFKEKYRDAYRGLAEASDPSKLRKEAELFKEIANHVGDGEWEEADKKSGKVQKMSYDPDFSDDLIKAGSSYNVFLMGMSNYFETSEGKSNVECRNTVDAALDWRSRNEDDTKPSLHEITHGRYATPEEVVIGVEEVIGEEVSDVQESTVKEYQDEIVEHIVRGNAEAAASQADELAGIFERRSPGEVAFENLDYDVYSASDSRVNEDMDVPHELGGVLADVFHDLGYSPAHIVKKQDVYGGMVKDAIVETINYGVETVRGETDQDWGESPSREYRARLASAGS